MIASTQTNYPLSGNGKIATPELSPVGMATTRLRAAGLRITQPRLAILATLARHKQPISIEQIHEEVGCNSCDLVTVYRCMAAFERIGVVGRAFFHNGTTLFKINLGQPTRYHVACKTTNLVAEIDEETAGELRRVVEIVQEKLRREGYTDVGHFVEFFGHAPTTSRTSAAVTPAGR